VLEGYRKELPITDICCREGISASIYYNWLKQFMEAGKERLKGDTLRGVTLDEVKQLCQENNQLKASIGQQSLELAQFKKVCLGRPKMVPPDGTLGKAHALAGTGRHEEVKKRPVKRLGHLQIDLLCLAPAVCAGRD
jgi:transposase